MEDPRQTCVDEALTCLTELIYNQDGLSEKMWQFFQHMIDSIMADKGQFDQYLDSVLVVLINFLNKVPEQIKTVQYPGQQMTCLQILCQLLAKIFDLAQVCEDEMMMSSGVCLANAIFENVKEVGPQVIPGVL